MAVNKFPTIPPMAWDANTCMLGWVSKRKRGREEGERRTSKESSYPMRNLSWVAKLHIVPAMNPNNNAAAVS